MKKRIVMAMVLAVMGTATVAHAHPWYQAKTCAPWLGGCGLDDCELSESTPAWVFQLSGGAHTAGNSIHEGDNGEVDVTGQTPFGTETIIFFRTKKACQAFIAPEVKEQKKEEQEQEKDWQDLKNYN
jgi:hypothetical protein